MKKLLFALLIFYLALSIMYCKRKAKPIITSETLFTLMTSAQTNINFKNNLSPNNDLNILNYNYYYNGGGVAAADFNNDGLTDLFFTGNQVPGKLFLNRGNFKFQEATEKCGIKIKNWATGISVVDINEDGLQDIYISYAGYRAAERRKHQLFINQGTGMDGIPLFKDEANEFGLADTSYTSQSCFFDFDKDGDLDVLLLNHFQDKTNPNFPKEKASNYISSSNVKLFRNDNNYFTNIAEEAGIKGEGYSLSAAISDINRDGWPDIYIAKDFVFDDALYINNKNGTFTETINTYVQHTSQFSMGCDIADINNDGYQDILVADMLPEDNKRQKLMNIAMNNDRFNYALSLGYMPQYSRNMLQLNNGPDGNGKFSFSEIGQLAGIFKTDWSWCPLIADFDNDGFKDIFITNGILKDITNNDFITYRSEAIQSFSDSAALMEDLSRKIEKLAPVNKSDFIFKNSGHLTFADVSLKWGFNEKKCSNGAVYADLDNDGDLDLITNNINSNASVYKNNSNVIAGNNFIRIKLNGKYSIGAKISIVCRGATQFLEHYMSRGFQSSQDPIEHFGLANNTVIDTLNITWLDGKQQQLVNVKSNQLIVLDYKNGHFENLPQIVKSKGLLFTDISETNILNYLHRENDFEDFIFEPLLPHRFSRNGPYISVGDLDKNGKEDFWIGGPANIPGKLFLQHSNGTFSSKNMPDSGYEDMGGVFFDANGDKNLDLYVVSGGNEYKANTATYQDRLYLNDGKGNLIKDVNALPADFSSGSCVIVNDIDKDGDSDLFVGGRITPGNYPLAPQSFLLLNNGKGFFVNATEVVCPELSKMGLVTAAIWSDFDNDGWADLIVTGEWMPVTIFKNHNGKLKKVSGNPALDSATGWWYSIAEGDFDTDGDMDYIVGNLGLNTKYNVSPTSPLSVYANDFDGNGSSEPILSYYLNGKEYTVANRDQITSVLPSIKKKFDTYTKFADAEFNEIFTKEQLSNAHVLKATKFASVYLENSGRGKFVFHDLPIEAQFSAIQSILVKDFDGDGNTDALVAGNFYSPEFMTGRYDASIGLLLKGNGKGIFSPVAASRSGICIRGDARGLATINIKNRPCFLAAINSAKLQLYQITSH